ncbi:MAG: translation initiation factor IF-2 [bacterium]|nr:translation initiation factor IF-2 [bacterium]
MTQYKIYKIAKELNLASTTIIEFLSNMGHEMPKGHMSTIDEELYMEMLKKFNRGRWQALQDQDKVEKIEVQKKESEKAREEDLRKILAETTEITRGKAAPAEAHPKKKEIKETKPAHKIEEKEALPAGVEPPEAIPVEHPVVIEEAKPELIPPTPEELPVVPVQATPELAVEPLAEVTPEPQETEEVEVAQAAPAEVEPAREEKKEQEKPKAEVYKPTPGTFEAMMQEAKRTETVARARELARAREAQVEGVTPEDLAAKKRRFKRHKEETPEELAIRRAVDRAQRAAKDRKKEKPAPAAATPATTEAPVAKSGKKRRRSKKQRVDQKVVDASIKQTLASMDEKRPKKRHRRVQHAGEVLEGDNILRVMEFISANELAALLDVPVAELIRKCLDMGLYVTINQRLDRDAIELLAGEYDYDVEFQSEYEGVETLTDEEADKEADLRSRPPVVTVMGHVDHGKTSLLDFLRNSNITAGESGGITQHIGAYSVVYQDKTITFLDTPGHEAFTAMRARGAQVTDLVVLVVAADDHVMPQTIEAINHAKAAGVPIVIAINKMDKPTADPERIRRELADQDVLVEEWGGKYQAALISAKTGQGVENLLEEIALAAEILDLKANPERRAKGIIIESRLDKGRGPLATILIQNGTLKIGDNFVAGAFSGRVKAMYGENGRKVTKVGPGHPAQLLGFDGTPQAGEAIISTATDKEAKMVSLKRQALQREHAFKQIRALSLENLSERIKRGEVRELPLIIKGDVNGSVEALSDALMKLNSPEVGVKIIHRGVGAITETDVNLAAASTALIIGFMVHPNLKSRELASRQDVEIRIYRIIYDVINDVKAALEGMLAPSISENHLGTLEVRQVFKVSKIGTIAGCYVKAGKIERSNHVRLVRDGQQIYEGTMSSLKRFKDDAKEVIENLECGVGIANFQDIKVGDVIEAFQIIETKRTLS